MCVSRVYVKVGVCVCVWARVYVKGVECVCVCVCPRREVYLSCFLSAS